MRRPRMPPVCHCRLQSPHMAQSVHVKGAFVNVVCCLCVWLSPWAVEPMKLLRSLSHHHPTTGAPAPCLYSTQYFVHSGLLLLLPYHVTILLRPCCCCCFSPLSLFLDLLICMSPIAFVRLSVVSQDRVSVNFRSCQISMV